MRCIAQDEPINSLSIFVLRSDNFVLCFDNFVLCFDNFVLCFTNIDLYFKNIVLCFKNCLLCLQIWATVFIKAESLLSVGVPFSIDGK